MKVLPEVQCPVCEETMKKLSGPVRRATGFEDCVRRCMNCGIGASNAEHNPTFIYEVILKNFPAELREGLECVLAQALNEKNRSNKRKRMGFVTSEDALTWVFFRYFVVFKKLDDLARVLSLKGEVSDVLLWGVSILDSKPEHLSKELRKACLHFGETKNRLSEPDVVIETPEEVTFIEVKLRAGNSIEKSLDKFDKYIANKYYSHPHQAIESGLYELVRNWSIGNFYAGTRGFRLLNLGPRKLFGKAELQRLDKFKCSLTGQERFDHLHWEDVLGLSELRIQPEWFTSDLKRRLRLTSG